ncbi:VOC family protein [Cellulomonas bogoriensis]|uniref:Glyoxalase n=1 Tax=Cellulomonas bogoriensis 69B4 = DSM 16987 TaxID=1386082 RepID=A0A0A0C2A4_9CELL|nr:VOC family protein [Cellulomonas bogoriensis]KGM14306.1 glyoxalase [Cellulomonas bogoriensis 69B4 = DSM 16987]
MDLMVEMVTFDARDPRALAQWWARQLGGEVVMDQDGQFVMVQVAHGPRLGFQKVEDPSPGKGRVHLDLGSNDPDVEVGRLLGDGALEVARHGTPAFSWVVMSDPEGNHFCVSQAH